VPVIEVWHLLCCPGEPLIFVEVALVQGLATAMPPLLARETDEEGAP